MNEDVYNIGVLNNVAIYKRQILNQNIEDLGIQFTCFWSV